MKQIKINNKDNQTLYTIVDDIDYYLLSKYRWYLKPRGYVAAYIKDKEYLIHRFIMNPNKGLYIDHKNHNKLDNRRSNLRICTQSENMGNSHAPNTNTTGYKGVIWDKSKNRYKARIMKNGIMNYIGSYKDINEAGKAYNNKAVELFGEFALLNQVGI